MENEIGKEKLDEIINNPVVLRNYIANGFKK